jgi:flagellar motor switch protein FliG
MSDVATRQGGVAARPAAVPPAKYSRSQKAAAVLLAIGPDASAKILAHLTEIEVEQVALEVATLGNLGQDELQPVLEEFHAEAQAHRHLVSGGESHAREILRKLRGSDGDEIVDRVLATVRTSPFHFLRQHDASELTPHLRDEHPQTVALILAHLPPKFAARVLEGLDTSVQSDIALRIALLDRTSPDVIQRVEDALRERIGALANEGDSEQGGVKDLASLLNQSDRHTEQAILARLEEHDPELAEQVRALMFVFEDIVTLDDRAVQEVLRQVDMKEVAVALKGVPDEVRATIERNLSERARETLIEEIELLGPVRIRDVEEAQTEVVRRIRQLEEEGAIVINRGGEGEFIE